MAQIEVARFNSTRNPNNLYRVRLDTDTQALWCECPGWRFSKATPKACRHTRTVQEQGLATADGVRQLSRLLVLERIIRDVAPGATEEWYKTCAQRMLSSLDNSDIFTAKMPDLEIAAPPSRLFTLTDE